MLRSAASTTARSIWKSRHCHNSPVVHRGHHHHDAAVRTFASSSSNDNGHNDHNGNDTSRLFGVRMHPESTGKNILPGGEYVHKFDKGSGEYRRILVERNHGSFWMLKELQTVDNKPILASLIAEEDALVLPTIAGVTLLSTDEKVDLPHHLLRTNRTKDPNSQCTVLGVSFKDYGYQLSESWLGQLEQSFASNPRVEVVRLTITEGAWIKRLLSGVMTRSMKPNVPPERRDRFLMHFGNEALLKDCLRMHNTLTGYVFVLDGLGRVRWAGSGKASPEELLDVETCIHNILPTGKPPPTKPRARERTPSSPPRWKVGETETPTGGVL
jgi:mitochondrial ATPase complex subunit ATP10